MRSKMPVPARVRATTMPPNSNASGPPAVFTAAMTSSSARILNPNSMLTPRRAATAMSIRSKAMARITAPNTTMVMYICTSVMQASRCSTDRWGVHQAALCPEPIETALEVQRAVDSQVALEHLAVVADALHGAQRPVGIGRERSPEFRGLAQRPSHGWIARALAHRAHVVARDAVLLGGDKGEQYPAHQRHPVVVAAPHDRRERLLGDPIGQDDERLRPTRCAQARGSKLRGV